MGVSHFHHSWERIIFPIGDAVHNVHSFEIGFENAGVIFMFLIVVMDLFKQARDIDASIRLSCKVEVVVFVLWKFLLKPLENNLEVIHS